MIVDQMFSTFVFIKFGQRYDSTFSLLMSSYQTEVDLETAKPMDQLSKTALDWCRSIGCTATTVTEILESNDKTFMQAIQQGIDRANDHAISRAQKIQKWTVLPRDFSIPGGEIGTVGAASFYICGYHPSLIEAVN